MRGAVTALLLGTLLVAQPPEQLERDALALVRARDYARLSKLLRDPSFLSKLDRASEAKNFRLGHVMNALAESPDQQTAELSHTLAGDSGFMADPDRMLFLLEVLGAVRPMTGKTASLFKTATGQGYFVTNALLLAANGSPLALGLFESMMLDRDTPAQTRIDCLHNSVMPRRTSLPILVSAENMLTRSKEEELAAGVIESVFHYRREWFRPASTRPPPPAWDSASKESLTAALRLADLARKRRLSPELRAALDRETTAIRKALGSR